MRSACCMALCAWVTVPFSISSLSSTSRPPVSITRIYFPRHKQIPSFQSRVVPAFAETSAFCSSKRRLKSVDLPTFVRPTRATVGREEEIIVITSQDFSNLRLKSQGSQLHFGKLSLYRSFETLQFLLWGFHLSQSIHLQKK